MDDLNLNEKKNAILGELDLLNSTIGLAKSFIVDRKIKKLLAGIQDDLFVIQANIAAPETASYKPPNITSDRILALQEATYVVESHMPALKNFIVPEGLPGACAVQVARAIARQVERKIFGYLNEPPILAVYLDRVAGLLFAIARYVNMRGGIKERPPKYVINMRKLPRLRKANTAKEEK